MTGVPPRLELILVRHAESKMRGCYLGHTDPPLSDRGRSQAAVLAQCLAEQPLAALCSSPLQRALHTAQAIAAPHGLWVEVVADLAELDFGTWDGLTYEQIERRDPERLSHWLEDPIAACPPGGETLAQMSERLIAAWRAIVVRRFQGAVVVVSHGGPIRALICHALGMPLALHWRIGLDIASITRLDWYGEQVVLSLLNDTCHLNEMRLG